MADANTDLNDGGVQNGNSGNSGGGTDLKTLQDRISYLETESKKAFEERDKAKGKLKEIEDGEKIKKGELQTLYDSVRQENEDLKKYKDLYEEIETSTKKDLLSKLSDKHKELAKSFDISTLREYVKLNAEPQGFSTDDGKGGKTKIDTTGKKWDDFTTEELDLIASSNRKEFDRLKKAKYPLLYK